MSAEPSVVVFSSLFPSSLQPTAGLFIRERKFRVGAQLPLTVVSPVPWFPLQGLMCSFRPGSRPPAPHQGERRDFIVWFPRFLSIPRALKGLDGLAKALGALPCLRRRRREGHLDLIDARFGSPTVTPPRCSAAGWGCR